MSSPPRRTKNAIEEHAFYNEAIKREIQYARINETFTLNPRNRKFHTVVMITEKPNRNAMLRATDDRS